ncbi:MAG: hypothetical protein GY707_06795 [Desulfobacteraceae bacterium]|nr:hypothetical protein [Desulfobacteraceae bacterium]
MKFSDFFVPKYIHSNPAVRLKFIANSNDTKLMEQMAEKDADEDVRKAAAERAQSLKGHAQTI